MFNPLVPDTRDKLAFKTIPRQCHQLENLFTTLSYLQGRKFLGGNFTLLLLYKEKTLAKKFLSQRFLYFLEINWAGF